MIVRSRRLTASPAIGSLNLMSGDMDYSGFADAGCTVGSRVNAARCRYEVSSSREQEVSGRPYSEPGIPLQS